MTDTPPLENPTRGNFERRFNDKLVGLLLAMLGFAISTALTFSLFWLNSLAGRIVTLETKTAVIESMLHQISEDVKDIKAEVKLRQK